MCIRDSIYILWTKGVYAYATAGIGFLFGSAFPHRFFPVSYTHLDVYKRQEKTAAEADETTEAESSVENGETDRKEEADVYKRQPLDITAQKQPDAKAPGCFCAF